MQALIKHFVAFFVLFLLFLNDFSMKISLNRRYQRTVILVLGSYRVKQMILRSIYKLSGEYFPIKDMYLLVYYRSMYNNTEMGETCINLLVSRFVSCKRW